MATGDITRTEMLAAGVLQQYLTDAAATLYTVPAGQRTVHMELDFCNIGSVELALVVYVVPNGEVAANNFVLIYSGLTYNAIQPSELRQYTFDRFLPAGTLIQGLSSTTGVITFGGSVVLEEV